MGGRIAGVAAQSRRTQQIHAAFCIARSPAEPPHVCTLPTVCMHPPYVRLPSVAQPVWGGRPVQDWYHSQGQYHQTGLRRALSEVEGEGIGVWGGCSGRGVLSRSTPASCGLLWRALNGRTVLRCAVQAAAAAWRTLLATWRSGRRVSLFPSGLLYNYSNPATAIHNDQERRYVTKQ